MFSRVRFLVVIFIFSMNSSAAPIVSSPINTSGLQQGDRITITGSNFGAKTVAKPLLWADFNQQIMPSSKGLRSSWSVMNAALTMDFAASNASQALRYDHSDMSQSVMTIESIRDAEGNRTQGLYLFVRKYYDYDLVEDKGLNGFNLKMYRFYSNLNNTTVHRNNAYFGYQGNDGKDSGRMSAENTEAQFNDFSSYYSDIIDHKPEKWLVHELIYKAGDAGPDPDSLGMNSVIYRANANGVYDLYEDGEKWSMGNVGRVFHDPNQPLLYQDLAFDQVSNGTGPGPIYTYYDEVYVDTTLQRVIICDANVFANCSKRAIQIPTAWANNSITVELNLGEFANFSDSLWLYVFDEDGVPNAEGMPIVCENCSDEGLCFPIKSANGNTAVVCL